MLTKVHLQWTSFVCRLCWAAKSNGPINIFRFFSRQTHRWFSNLYHSFGSQINTASSNLKLISFYRFQNHSTGSPSISLHQYSICFIDSPTDISSAISYWLPFVEFDDGILLLMLMSGLFFRCSSLLQLIFKSISQFSNHNLNIIRNGLSILDTIINLLNKTIKQHYFLKSQIQIEMPISILELNSQFELHLKILKSFFRFSNLNAPLDPHVELFPSIIRSTSFYYSSSRPSPIGSKSTSFTLPWDEHPEKRMERF